VEELIGTLDVEERARTKDNGKGVETSTANVVQKRNFRKFNKKKNQNKQKNTNKPIQTTQFKKKNNNNNKGKRGCFVCGSDQHWARECHDRTFTQDKKSANVVTTETGDGTSGYGNSLPFVLSVCNSPEWWMDSGANIHVCADASMFTSYQVGRSGALLMGNGSRTHVLGVGTIILKFISGKTVPLKSVQHVPSIKKNLVSASMLCRDGYKVVLESNKYVVSKHGTFVGKGYDCGGLFRLSLHDVCNKMVNSVHFSDESDLWHSRFCYASFGCLMRLANLNLIPKFKLVKKSKCHVCVESKQPRKPHKAAEARNLAPLELVHSDLREMNGILTKGGKRYFLTFIDDSTRFCYVYLLKTKDEAFNYLRPIKLKLRTNLRGK
jgi:hypothetical protein